MSKKKQEKKKNEQLNKTIKLAKENGLSYGKYKAMLYMQENNAVGKVIL